MKKIGIGCFHFKATKKVSHKEYIILLKNELDKITNISNLEIDVDEKSWRSGFLPEISKRLNRENYDFETSSGYYPAFIRGSIKFDIFIPKKTQNKIYEPWSYKNNENFNVEIYFTTTFTFTVIEPKFSQDNEGGSSSVMLVREFIIEELKNINSSIELEIIGPSPFHVDVELELIEETKIKSEKLNPENLPIFTNVLHKKGYDKLKIYGSNLVYGKNEDILKKTAIKILSDELSLFYFEKLSRNHKLHQISELNHLLSEAKENFYIKRWKYKKSISEIIEKLYIKIVELKYYQIIFIQKINKQYSDLRKINKCLYLEKLDQDNNEAIFSDEAIENISSLVNFMEKRDSHYNNNINLFVSTIIGVILGVCFTFVFGTLK